MLYSRAFGTSALAWRELLAANEEESVQLFHWEGQEIGTSENVMCRKRSFIIFDPVSARLKKSCSISNTLNALNAHRKSTAEAAESDFVYESAEFSIL